MPTYWTVPRAWTGTTAFLLAGGPSLCGFDAEVLRNRGHVIAINNSYLLCPWADVLYFGDHSWWQAHGTKALETFRGQHIITCGPVDHPRVHRLRNTGHCGLERQPDGLKHGCNSGYQAINLAYHFGAARIALLGYDMQLTGGRTHWHAGHAGIGPERIKHNLEVNMLPRFPSLMEPLKAAGVEVINASPDSALTCWPHKPLAEILKETP